MRATQWRPIQSRALGAQAISLARVGARVDPVKCLRLVDCVRARARLASPKVSSLICIRRRRRPCEHCKPNRSSVFACVCCCTLFLRRWLTHQLRRPVTQQTRTHTGNFSSRALSHFRRRSQSGKRTTTQSASQSVRPNERASERHKQKHRNKCICEPLHQIKLSAYCLNGALAERSQVEPVYLYASLLVVVRAPNISSLARLHFR